MMLVSPLHVTLGRRFPADAVKGEGIWAKYSGGEPGQRSMMTHTSPHCSGGTTIVRIVGIEIVGEQHSFDLFFLVYSNYTYFLYL